MNVVYKGAAYCLSSLLAGGGALNPALTLALAVVRQVAIISQSFVSFYQYLYSPFFLLIVAILPGKAIQPVQLPPLLPSATCPDTCASYR